MVEIRRFSPDDEREIAEISQDIWSSEIWESYSIEGKIEQLEEMERRDTIFLVAEDDEEVVGYIFAYPFKERDKPYPEDHSFWEEIDGEVLYIDELGVTHGYRDRGIGTDLFEEMIALVDERFEQVLLRTNPEAKDALHIYEKHGFRDLRVDDPEHPERTYLIKNLLTD